MASDPRKSSARFGLTDPRTSAPAEAETEAEGAPIFLREWMTALNVRGVTIRQETGITEGYISSLKSGRRKNPGQPILKQIADVLGISVPELYRPPPSDEDLAKMGPYSAQTLARLRAAKTRKS
jgi:hypothetical protein